MSGGGQNMGWMVDGHELRKLSMKAAAQEAGRGFTRKMF